MYLGRAAITFYGSSMVRPRFVHLSFCSFIQSRYADRLRSPFPQRSLACRNLSEPRWHSALRKGRPPGAVACLGPSWRRDMAHEPMMGTGWVEAREPRGADLGEVSWSGGRI